MHVHICAFDVKCVQPHIKALTLPLIFTYFYRLEGGQLADLPSFPSLRVEEDIEILELSQYVEKSHASNTK